MTNHAETIRVAALGDTHCTQKSYPALKELFSQVNGRADLLLLCGDLTDYGLPEEAHVLADALSSTLRIPVVGVLGNHDYESGKSDEVERILRDAGIHLLDGGTYEHQGLGIAGVKGFIGGFGQRTLAPWGETAIKIFVQESVSEARKLESALAQLETPQRIVLLHYAPIEQTVEGEPREIYPFLGSSHLEHVIDRHPVAAVFHGHAHRGALEGRTQGNIPVYNVAWPLLKRALPGHPGFHVVEFPASSSA